MKLIFENWRRYLLLSEAQILVEGRISDTARKYPELAKKREDFDGESLLDVIIDADPSGNQKYLMGAARILFTAMKDAEESGDGYKNKPFWGKLWPEDAPENIYSPWGIAKNIASKLQEYHDLMPYIRGGDEKFKDINMVKKFRFLNMVVANAKSYKEVTDRKKKEEEELKIAAKEGTEFIAKTPYHLIVRPLTKEASCHWGMGTKWCISATESENYFDQYTQRDGKSFLFLLAKRKYVESDWKKIAVVLDREGDFEEYFDSADDSMQTREFEAAVSQAIVGTAASNSIVSMDEKEPYDAEVIRKGLEPFKGQNGFDFDADDGIREVVALFRNTFLQSYIADLEEAGKISVEETPSGTPDEAYEEALSAVTLNHVDVTLSFPYETGSDHVYWDSSLWIDVESIINSLEDWELVTDEPDEDDIRSAVDDALNAVNINPEMLEAVDVGTSDEVYTFNARLEQGGGSLDEFESFLTDAEYVDNIFSFTEDFTENLIEQLEENGVIENPEKERQKTRDAKYWPDPEEKKKQLELPLQENKIRIRVRRKR